ncbi:MAG TPA: hypothetical protein VFA18_11585 [Gemmataceae bacterium]|nr:hypothetical protein [Gemmataceae bacterium]
MRHLDHSSLHDRTETILAQAREQRQQLEQQLQAFRAERQRRQRRARQASLDGVFIKTDGRGLASTPKPGLLADSIQGPHTHLPDCPDCWPARS